MRNKQTRAAGVATFGLALLCALSGAWMTTPTFASNSIPYPVSVSVDASGAGTANGALGTARNGAGSAANIGCTHLYSGGTHVAACVATDANNQSGACIMVDSVLIHLVSTLNEDSYLSFTWDSSGMCTAVSVTNASQLEPKLP